MKITAYDHAKSTIVAKCKHFNYQGTEKLIELVLQSTVKK